MKNLEEFVLYEVKIESLQLTLSSGPKLEFPEMFANGRASYVMFEQLVRYLTGLEKSKGSDHQLSQNARCEQKAFSDIELYPKTTSDYFQTSASSTFPANNFGPTIKKLLESNDYQGALRICKETGYNHNDFYIYTNTKGFKNEVPFRYVVVPTSFILSNLNPLDPREISRKAFLGKITKIVTL
jgi:hypothetical protein